MPNILYIRPCDAEEAVGSWMMALDHRGPTILGLNRGAVPLQAGTCRQAMRRGAYVIEENAAAKVTLISTGGDLYQAVDAAKILCDTGIPTRVVSMPSMGVFEKQTPEYIQSVIPRNGRPVISIEAMSTHGWAKWYVVLTRSQVCPTNASIAGPLPVSV